MNHGFLPNRKPLISLPLEFQEINDLITNMTYWQKDGTASGLLAKDLFRKTVDKDFPDLMTKIMKTDPDDIRLNTALLRDYQILAAAYMLEPCHISFLKTKNYGIGSDFIPENLAIPMKYLSDRLDCK